MDVPSAIELYFCNLRASTTTWYVTFDLRPVMSKWSSVNQSIYIVQSNTGTCQSKKYSDICQSKKYSDICQAKQYSDICQSKQYSDTCQSKQYSDICQSKQYSDISVKAIQRHLSIKQYSDIYQSKQYRDISQNNTVHMSIKALY